MPLTCTYTKTFNILDAWAETIPWTCDKPGHRHVPMANVPCAVGSCGEPLLKNEVCYAVTELPRLPDGPEQWVCWRHIKPDDGPIRVI